MTKFDVPGRLKLQHAAEEKTRKTGVHWGPTELAKFLGGEKLSQSTVSRWLSGDSRPSEPWRRVIWNKLRVPAGDWMTAEEKGLGAA
jgi:hypothetical protein